MALLNGLKHCMLSPALDTVDRFPWEGIREFWIVWMSIWFCTIKLLYGYRNGCSTMGYSIFLSTLLNRENWSWLTTLYCGAESCRPYLKRQTSIYRETRSIDDGTLYLTHCHWYNPKKSYCGAESRRPHLKHQTRIYRETHSVADGTNWRKDERKRIFNFEIWNGECFATYLVASITAPTYNSWDKW